jgi:glycosyltransferase involved in cell wall biosynthesis
MTPVEVMACGRPVIAFGKGGALETILDGVTGLLVDRQDACAFADAIARFERMAFDPGAIRRNAERFSMQRFADAIYTAVDGTARSTQREPRARLLATE